MKVGILYPSSAVYPTIAFEFIDGLKAFLKYVDKTSNVEWLMESIGFGGSEKEVYTTAEKLLLFEEIDILIAYIDLKVLDILNPLFSASGKLIFVVNPGANYPTNWVPRTNVIHHTLLDAFCCWMTAAEASELKNKQAVSASTFYDCGYLHSASMSKSYWKNGGEIVYNYVNNDRYDDSFGISDLSNYLLANEQVTNLLCQFDTAPAALFYCRLNEIENLHNMQIFASPMMLEKNAIDSIQNDRFNIRGYQSWSAAFDCETNRNFTVQLKNHSKKSPTLFSLLGWELGMILEIILKNENTDFSNGESIVSYLKDQQINSPRGELILDVETNFYLSCPLQYSMINGEIILEQSSKQLMQEQWNQFTNEPTLGAITGWTNTYLCY